ncbi:MAG: aspartyl-phosphate phosphatase Spo0E family protein [Sporomusaceae bacterium]|nr:aspartyl-phosphate phosphatase Spo0E family protein [Sporomusaceae bacterium]
MSEIQISLYKVEKIREQLHLIIRGRSLTDPEVVGVSQQLDQALNEYRYISNLSQPVRHPRCGNSKP